MADSEFAYLQKQQAPDEFAYLQKAKAIDLKQPPKSRYEEPLIHFEKYLPETKTATTGLGQASLGAVRGVAETLSGLTSPAGIATTTGLVVGEYLPGVGPVIAKAAGAYFTYGAARNVIDSVPEARKAMDQGNWGVLGEIVGSDVLNGLFGYLGGRELMRDHPFHAVPKTDTTRQATAGMVSQAPGWLRRKAETFVGESAAQKLESTGKQIFRARRGPLDREMAVAQAALRDDYIRVEGLPQTEKYAIVDDIEQAKDRNSMRQTDPANQAVAEKMSKLLDEEWDKILDLNIPGLDKHFYDTYFPHLWKQPERAQKVIQDWYSNKPLTGSESFRRRRTHFTFEEGRRAGLTPLTDNPIEMALLKLKEVKKFRMGQEVLNDLEARGLMKSLPLSYKIKQPDGTIKKVPARMPDGWARVEDKSFKLGPRGIRGDLIVPAPVAKIIHSYLSTGLRDWLGSKIPGVAGGAAAKTAQVAQWYNSNANMLNVSMSGFHVLLESGLSWMNEVALAARYPTRYFSRKNALGGSMAWAPARDFFQVGKAFMDEYYNPNSNPTMTALVQAYEKGGGRFRSDPLMREELQYRSSIMDKFWDRWQADARKNGTEVIPEKLRYAFDFTMQHWVPRLKAAAFARMAEFELERLGPNASEDAVRTSMTKIVDSIDNRMGQMNFDNVFLPKMLKDVGFLSVHFLGWTWGTLREGGGGILDLMRQPVRKALGLPMEWTNRAAWTLALPFTFGIMNGIYNGIMTESWKPSTDYMDYIAPRNGRTRPDGTPERDALPFTAYLREYYEWMSHAKQTAGHKWSNLLFGMYEMWTNTDFLGRQVYNPQGNAPEIVWETMKYLVQRAEPISWQTFTRESESGQPLGSSLGRAVFGVRAAPANLMRTAAQNLILDWAPIQMKAIDEETFERKEAARKLMEGIWSKRQTLDDAKRAYDDHKITINDLKKIIHIVKVDPWLRNGTWGKRFIALDPIKALTIFRIANPEEKRKMQYLMPHLEAKLLRMGQKAKADAMKAEVEKEIQKLGSRSISPPATAADEFNYVRR